MTADQPEPRPADPTSLPLDRFPADLPESPAPGTPPAAILESARTLFAEKGFAGTSTRSIAAAAGVNLAMIHYYFGNKNKLYGRVMEEELTRMLRIMQEGLAAEAAPQDVLAALPGFILDLHRQRPELMQLLLRDMTDGHPRLPTVVRDMGLEGPLGLRQALFDVIAAAQAEGFAVGIPAAHLVAVFFGVSHGLMAFAPLIATVLGLDMRDPDTAAAVADSASTVLTRALAPVKEK